MKKFSLIIATAMLAATVGAQVHYDKSGQFRIGQFSTNSTIVPGLQSVSIVNPPTSNQGDLTAPLRVMSLDTSGSSSRIAFGNLKAGSVGLGVSTSGQGDNNVITLTGEDGIEYYTSLGNMPIFRYRINRNSLTYTQPLFTFNTEVKARQFLTSSDTRLKTQIEELDNAGASIKDLNPVSYVLKEEAGESGEAAKAAASGKTGHRQYGFLAQEVREIYPDLVHEDADGMLSLDYNGFIPLLVDAVRQLQAKVEEQAETIKALGGDNEAKKMTVASMSQNKPNPFSSTTVITCEIPENVATAFLCVYDLNGGQKLRRDIRERGKVDVTIDANSLDPGMYIYTLIADGAEVDTKRMILTD